MKVLVTGAGGFIGQHLCIWFSQLGYEVIALGRISQEKERLLNQYAISKIVNIDISFNDELVDFFRKNQPDVCIHSAGGASVNNSFQYPYKDYHDTVESCISILEAIRQGSLKTFFVYLSSAAVYGNPVSLPINESSPISPISPYGYNKMICERIIEEYTKIYGIQSLIFRIFSVYGNGLKKQILYDLCKKFSNREMNSVELFGDGTETRDFIHIQDAVKCIDLFVHRREMGIFNLATGLHTEISRLAVMVKKELESDKSIIFKGDSRAGDPSFWQADTKQLRGKGFIPEISIEKGVSSYCKWFTQIMEGV
ncbi:NAD-dependent epimerase/dehydratase family protein [Paenibacillus oryzisoli]|uniref:NAD-dependent epimerase/dehydratase family protein n=1 Tax=Paenibacillus oryzisoli TaxID=1850517 RepID=UPI003D269AB3